MKNLNSSKDKGASQNGYFILNRNQSESINDHSPIDIYRIKETDISKKRTKGCKSFAVSHMKH